MFYGVETTPAGCPTGRPGTRTEALGVLLIPHAGLSPCEWRARLFKRRQKDAAAGRALLGPQVPRLNFGYAQWLESFQGGIEESVELVVSS